MTIIVGAGGTGSYLIPNILRQYDEDFINHKVVVLDGDYLEEKNLMRQGFFKDVIHNSKSEAMYKMHSPYFRGLLDFRTQFLNFSDELLNLIHNDVAEYDEVVLISCVDNNLARLRLFVGQQLIKNLYPEMRVLFVDSGNEEWFGQTLVNFLDVDDKPFLTFHQNMLTIQEDNINMDKIDSILPRMEDWRNQLTRGDHEMSCDDNVVSHPQNIATNMMASNLLLYTLNRALDSNVVESIRFDVIRNTTSLVAPISKEDFIVFLNELVEFLKTEEGLEVISPRFVNFNAESESIYVQETLNVNRIDSNEIEETNYREVNFSEIKRMIKELKTVKKPKPKPVVAQAQTNVVSSETVTQPTVTSSTATNPDVGIPDFILPSELAIDFSKSVAKKQEELGLVENTSMFDDFDFDLDFDVSSDRKDKKAFDFEIDFDSLFEDVI